MEPTAISSRTRVDDGSPAWRLIWRAGYVMARRLGRLVSLLVALQAPTFSDVIVELRLVGRRSARPRPVLVTLLRLDGRWYVGHPNGPSGWLANLRAADKVMLLLPRQPPLWVRSTPLELGPERDAVIRATASQQPLPVRPLYWASRRHILRAGVYHRLRVIDNAEDDTPLPGVGPDRGPF